MTSRRLIACLVLVLATLVAPLESGLLPSAVQDLAASPAAAQEPPPVPVDSGTPDPCRDDPAPWSPQSGDADYLTSSECVLELPACPQSPLFEDFPLLEDSEDRPQFMRLSVPPDGLDVGYPDVDGLVGYPDFCEERVLDSDPAYGACLGRTGYVVTQYTDPDTGQMGCRLLHPIECPVGLYMASSKTCRAVERRNWTCEDEQVPRNEFNSCYRLPGSAPDPHPACGAGSPDFVAMACEDYVGGDYITNPADVACGGTYVTGTPVNNAEGETAVPDAPPVSIGNSLRSGESSDYWCSYESRFLNADCHRTNLNPVPDVCTTESLALCLKRASQTGGCDAIAKTIRCRAYEAAYRQRVRRGGRRGPAVPLEEVRLQGCTPCVILPFSPVPGGCPDDTDAEPRRGRPIGFGYTLERRELEAILREEDDFSLSAAACRPVIAGGSLAAHADCEAAVVCPDPPRGSTAWESTHIARVAVVNAPIIVTVADLRITEEPAPAHRYDSGGGGRIVYENTRRRLVYHDDSSSDARVRTFFDFDEDVTLATVEEVPRGDEDDPGGECVLRDPPRFKLVVRELWPDYGPVYEDNEPDCVPVEGEQTGRSDAEAILALFGRDSLSWWCALSGEERSRRTLAKGLKLWDDSETDRAGRLEELTTESGCDWTNDGEIVWCRWVPDRPGFYRLHVGGAWDLYRYVDRERSPESFGADLARFLADPDEREEIRRQLRDLGLSPADIGLNPDVTGMLPLPEQPDWMYSEPLAPQTNCPSIDLRVSCNLTMSGNYTETEPVGVKVHEVRAHTVTPSR